MSKASNAFLEEEGEDNDLLKMQGGSISTEKYDYYQKSRVRAAVSAETVHTVEAARECQLEFFKRMPSTVCQNCGAHNPTIKKYVQTAWQAIQIGLQKVVSCEAAYCAKSCN